MSELFFSFFPNGRNRLLAAITESPGDHFSMDTPPENCHSLENPSYTNLGFSIFILLGILISYLPQHHRIISRKSSEGISPFFLLLGVTSGTCTFLNIVILSKGVLSCCKWIGGFNCFAAGLGVAQVGMQWICFAVILLLFLIYFPRQPDLTSAAATITTGSPHDVTVLHRYRQILSTTHPSPITALLVALFCVVHFLIHLFLAIFIPASNIGHYASFLGIQATVLASVQYIPQIYTTWKLQHVGSLSIPMMCIQTPGSFVWAISLAAREGTEWSSWITYVVTGMLQGCLLIMCIIFEYREKKAKQIFGEVQSGGYGAVGNGVVTAVVGDDAHEGDREPLLGRRVVVGSS